MKETLKTIIKEWQNTFPNAEVRKRALEVPLDTKKIISLIGPRRCGKTFLAYQLINQLCSQGAGDRVVYINFEDERLEIEAPQSNLILEAYYELYPTTEGQAAYFFFDEIQEIEGWEKFVRRLYDSVSKNVFIIGSSARMLGKEIATGLRGRNLVYTLMPLSFGEFCEFHDVDLSDVYSTQAKALLKTHLEWYMQFGAYPETVFMPEVLIPKNLQAYFDVMLFRDIVERHEISNPLVLKQFLKRALGSVAHNFSVHKFYNELKSQGIAISKNTVYEYLDYSVDCFLLFEVFPYEPSQVKEQTRGRKIYAVDSGLLNSVTFRYSKDKGKLLENMVFLHLIRQGHVINYLGNKFECDFIVRDDERVTQALQVCWSLQDPLTRQRELSGLMHAAKQFDLREAYVITLDEEEELEMEGIGIHIRPAWKWLLTAK